MWAAFVRQFAAYAITRRGKKLFALAGVLLLCFATALLIDMQFTISAAFTAALAACAGVAFVVQHVRLKTAERERLARKAEEARIRAIAAQARLDRIDNAKSAIGDAAGAAARVVTENVRAVANEAVLVVTEAADAVGDAAQRATDSVETAARAGLTPLVKGWRYLRGRERTAA
ncbi:MAG: hypothetical protein AB7O50_03515 [Pseudolabrys sp.]